MSKVTFTYFKPSGKYYTNGTIEIDGINDTEDKDWARNWMRVMEFIRLRQWANIGTEDGKAPGLSTRAEEFYILVGKGAPYPTLVYPKTERAVWDVVKGIINQHLTENDK